MVSINCPSYLTESNYCLTGELKCLLMFSSRINKVYFPAGHHNNTYITKHPPCALEYYHPSLISESVVESLPSFRKRCLLTSWLNRDQGTCHIENLKQAPFGSSQGHSFCAEERKCAKFSFQSFIVENTAYLYTIGFGSDIKKRKLEVLIGGTLLRLLFTLLCAPHRFPYTLSTLYY